MSDNRNSRRRFLHLSVLAGGAFAGCRSSEEAPEPQTAGVRRLGAPVGPYGERSPYVKAVRRGAPTKTPEEASTMTPLQDCYGIITPSSLHFERHHAGVPEIDPAQHELVIHGLVERPLVFTMDELRRLPSVSRIHFIECAGNSRSEWGSSKAPTAQSGYGMASCSEWTGVLLRVLLEEAGLRPEATWLLVEGGDACRMARSLPVGKAMDDVIVAYGQNGEPLRPEQGFPLRLVIPGWEGNINVKWLRRIEAIDQPYMTRDETSKYTDLMPGGKARQFTFEMEAKSVITHPSGGQTLDAPGFYEIGGLAWSGRGLITGVEVSTDGGKSWQQAELQEPRHRIAFTRFRLPWRWDGRPARILSRCTDETGYRQPAVEELIAARGTASDYHCNAIKVWQITEDGKVSRVDT